MAKSDLTGDMRLATYGTLIPGGTYHHLLDGLNGRWITGTVCGRIAEVKLGARSYPAMILDKNESPSPVHVLESKDLPNHWRRLDGFETDAYRRVITCISLDYGAVVDASIYVLAT